MCYYILCVNAVSTFHNCDQSLFNNYCNKIVPGNLDNDSELEAMLANNGSKKINVNTSDTIDPIDYLGQTPPGDSAVIFAPGIISQTGRKERTLTFTPDGKEIYFTVINGNNDYTIKQIIKKDGEWQEEETAGFISRHCKWYSCRFETPGPYDLYI